MYKDRQLRKAKEYAFLLLKFRLRSRRELYTRLKKKKFSEDIINEILSFLEEKDFINDSRFCKEWIASRIKRSLGLKRIRGELRLKGIDPDTIDAYIQEIGPEYSEEDKVIEIVKERFDKLKDIEPLKAKRRIYGYLARRGFPPDLISDAINRICRQTY